MSNKIKLNNKHYVFINDFCDKYKVKAGYGHHILLELFLSEWIKNDKTRFSKNITRAKSNK